MSGTAKKQNYLKESWVYPGSFIQEPSYPKEFLSSIQDHLFDPFSPISLTIYQSIEEFILTNHIDIRQDIEAEKKILDQIAEELHFKEQTSLTLIKKSIQQTLLKRKVIPKECFESFGFQPARYFGFLFQELIQKSHKNHSILSLCYRFASEIQETVTLLKGVFLKLEPLTLKLVLFLEHQTGHYKHPTLFIQNPLLLELSVRILLQSPSLSTKEHFACLSQFTQFAQNEKEENFLAEIFSGFDLNQKLPSIFQCATYQERLSFLFHFEKLFFLFNKSPQKILDLATHYLGSIEQKELFFEMDCFYEIPIIVDLLFILLQDFPFEDQKTQILSILHQFIRLFAFHEGCLFDCLESDSSCFENQIVAQFFHLFEFDQEGSFEKIVQIFSTFKSLQDRELTQESNLKLKLLSEEKMLACLRLPPLHFKSLFPNQERNQFKCDNLEDSIEKLNQLIQRPISKDEYFDFSLE